MIHYAHTATFLDGTPDPDCSQWQPLYTGTGDGHLERVAALATKFAAAFGAEDWAWLAGWWHDLGKFSPDFQAYLRAATGAEAHLEERPDVAARCDHSTAGAKHACAIAPRGVGVLLAYLIAGHHAGLPNGRDDTSSCLEARLAKRVPEIQFVPQSVAHPQNDPVPPVGALESGYGMGFFLRFCFSALVDADWLDTEQFMSEHKAAARSTLSIPSLPELRECLNEYLGRFEPPTTPVQRARAEVLRACRAAASKQPGLFSLTVPTGGGKTLSSLAFAVEHAIQHGLERIIYVLPFTSIIEQNAAVFRRVFARLGIDVVVEHHSSLDHENDRTTPAARLATENWDARIVVTTNVQFFESLHAARPGRCRKLHRLARSVIVLDEAQTLPLTLLKPCVLALQELAGSLYGASLVLCTATQPAIEHRADFPFGLRGVRKIIQDEVGLFAALRRVKVTRIAKTPLPDNELTDQLASHRQVLCIVNTRRHAAELYRRLSPATAKYHLSALMCPAHRSEVIGDPMAPAFGTIRHALKHDLPCVLISTQLIEAGVDVDFPVVFRALAGLDSIAQAAGRCNREGKASLGHAFVFTPEASIPAGFLRKSADAANEVLPNHVDDPLSPEAIESYFRLHYWRNANQADAKDILGCFPSGSARSWTDPFLFRFKDCAEAFRFIEDGYESVLVPWGDRGLAMIEELRAAYSPTDQRRLARRLQRYVVQVPKAAAAAHHGRELGVLHERYTVLQDPTAYSPELGLQLVSDRIYDPEQLFVA